MLAIQQEMKRQQQEANHQAIVAQQEINLQFAEALLELKKGSAGPLSVEQKMVRAITCRCGSLPSYF